MRRVRFKGGAQGVSARHRAVVGCELRQGIGRLISGRSRVGPHMCDSHVAESAVSTQGRECVTQASSQLAVAAAGYPLPQGSANSIRAIDAKLHTTVVAKAIA